jgi:glycosyltransferase Alg8
MQRIAAHLLYLSLTLALAKWAVSGDTRAVTGGLLVVGVLGAWRYSWVLLNLVRATLYIQIVFPQMRWRAEAAYARKALPAHAYFLLTSFKIEPDVTTRVYRSVFRAAAASAGGATIVASVVDSADARLIGQIYAADGVDPTRVKLLIDQIPGTGKRDALARSFRLLAREAPSRHDILAVVDGDSCVPEDLVARTAPFFTDPRVGALTTDEVVEIANPGLFRDWFRLRFTQRQIMMSSMGLSGRVLTLTGRMSVFRADLATRSDFIALVQSDHIDHWRLGRVNFLTGDDKSTWFWLLKNGWRMPYLPDVASLSMESQPKPGFVDSAVTLMVRWFGNMLRTNGRAVALSPTRIGPFTWWSILDQRLSIWTTLAGPISVLIGAVVFSPLVLVAYVAWVMLTRYVFTAVLALTRPSDGFPISYPFLLYFGQIMGAAVKSYVLFRLDRQRWTRQQAARLRSATLPLAARLRGWSSTFAHGLALGWLTLGVALVSAAR